MHSAIQSALDKIEADSRAWVAMRDKVQSDPRYIALTTYSKSLEQPINRNGWEGHGQMVDQLMSSRHWRAKRAAELATVREGQIKGLPGYAKAWLRRAAEHRKTEHLYRSTERRPVSLEVATDAFCAMLSAPYAVDEVA
jgi:hypothetical protein